MPLPCFQHRHERVGVSYKEAQKFNATPIVLKLWYMYLVFGHLIYTLVLDLR